MTITERFFEAYEYLKGEGLVASQTAFAAALSTNKAGISDLKAGRKKISIENLQSMSNSYPIIDIEWLVTGRGSMLKPKGPPPDNYVIELQKKHIEKLEAEIIELKKDNKPESYGLHAAEPDTKLKRKRHWNDDQ